MRQAEVLIEFFLKSSAENRGTRKEELAIYCGNLEMFWKKQRRSFKG
jgi:hypothetical protein